MTEKTSEFFFCLCQEGVERVLRQELSALGFLPSFQAKGFVTAKSPTPLSLSTLPSPVLARRTCLSVGKAAPGSSADVEAVAAAYGATKIHSAAGGEDAVAGDVVVSTVDAGGSVFVGVHAQHLMMPKAPLGDPKLSVPASSPSRAWLKLEEAARAFPLRIDAGDVVVEVGCAPGGVTRALLDRGAVVVGVDPNAMDERILRDRAFTHLRCSGQQAVDLPRVLGDVGAPKLLVVDINQRPNAAISGVERIIETTRFTLRQALFTLKLGDWKHFDELGHWRRRLERMLQMTTTATQLPANRQELCVFCQR